MVAVVGFGPGETSAYRNIRVSTARHQQLHDVEVAIVCGYPQRREIAQEHLGSGFPIVKISPIV